MNMKTVGIGMVAAVLLMASSTTFAVEPQGWKVEITPYAWLAGIEGDVTVDGQKADFDKSFSDLVDAVELAGSLLGVVQYNRFLLWGQVDYFSMSTDELDVEDRPQGGSLDSDLLLGELGQAEEHAHRAGETGEKLGLVHDLWKPYATLAEIARARGNTSQAAEWEAKRDAVVAELERRAQGGGGLPD